ncbi:DUF4290 domain-containing protein [Porphyromonadaceae bacterium W3.11]|nr:DUF4290 domain-containing protein [Porphyromonadaceae bacterium W3.11]
MKYSYNTKVKPLILPEYGRHVQNMVDYCLTIEDRAERQKCAEVIIQTMSFFSNKQKEREDYWQVLWDHLHIMSDFKLDIDFPVQVTTREEYEEKLERHLDNDHQKKPSYRHYGHTIERMIAATLAETDEEKRDQLAKLTALQMKRNYMQWNNESVANSKIFADLFELSKGEIYLDEMTCNLPDEKEMFGFSSNGPNNHNNHNSNNKSRKINVRRRTKK